MNNNIGIRAGLLAAAVALASRPAVALDFSRTIFFGDSLTDSGAYAGAPDAGDGTSFTTDPGNVWAENLADFFGTGAIANNPNNPATDPTGTNYAQGGAQVTTPYGVGQSPSPQSGQPISTQIDTYLAGVDRADTNALYTVWGGANDVFFNAALVGGGLPVDSALLNMGQSASDLIAQVERLSAAGARYILVPNLPDIGATPSSVLSVIVAAGEGNPALTNALITAVTILAQPGGDAATQAIIVAQALGAAESILGLPAQSLTPAYQQLAGLNSGLSTAFNTTLLGAMQASDANIIPLDIFSLLNEVSADPGAFGLINVTAPACVTPSALACTTDTVIDPSTPALFLYADSVHPTSGAHEVLSDYALSVISAPALMANLPEVALGSMLAHQDLLAAQLSRQPQGAGYFLFGSIGYNGQDVSLDQAWDSESDAVQALLGVGRRLNQSWVLAAALGFQDGTADFADDAGDFDHRNLVLSGVASYRAGAIFADLTASVALVNEFDATRTIALGQAVREESGDTDGSLYAIKAAGGYDFVRAAEADAGPYASLDYVVSDVDGYRESGQRSTSMHFGDQDRDALLVEAGLFGRTVLGQLSLSGTLGYEWDLQDDERSVRAGLNTLPGVDFRLYDIAPQGDAWKLGLRAEMTVADGVALSAGYRLRSADGDNDSHLLDLGFRVELD